MLRFLGFAAMLLGATVVIHSVGTAVLIRWLQHCEQRELHRGGWFTRSMILVITGISLMMLHLIEMCLWALVYWNRPELSEITSFEDAFYFSAVTFTTLGYGDITIEHDTWRMLCGLEALNGILLAGWSTALLFFVVKHLWEFDERHQ